MVTALEQGLSGVGREEWNALAGSGSPFLRHEFLGALEDNGCVGPGTGWQPTHLLCRHPAFRQAITAFLESETPHIGRRIEMPATHSPFKARQRGSPNL